MQEYTLMILNQLIYQSNGTFKMEIEDGQLMLSSRGFKYAFYSNNTITLNDLNQAQAIFTAYEGVQDGWIQVPKKAK